MRQIAVISHLPTILHNFVYRIQVLLLIGQIMLLKHQSKGRIISTNTLNRCLQMEETLLLYRRDNLRAEATSDGCLMTHYQLARLLDAACNAFYVPGKDGTQIDEFAGYAILRGKFARHPESPKLGTPTNNGDIGTWTDDFGFPEWYFVVSVWNIFDCRSIENLYFDV